MTNLYINFDNTVVESNKRILELLKDEKDFIDLNDYIYKKYKLEMKEQILDIISSDEFFNDLIFKDGFLDFFNKNKYNYNFIFYTIGNQEKINKTQEWIEKNISKDLKCIDFNYKNKINMKNSVQINDSVMNFNTNAKIKILYKDYNNFKKQKNLINNSILAVNKWSEIDEILSFFNKYDYKTLKNK